MYQILSSSIVAAPCSQYVLKLLESPKALYVPSNGTRTTNAVSDTKEDMMEIFTAEPVAGAARENKRLMGRRNYVAVVVFDPEAAVAATGSYAGSVRSGLGMGMGDDSLRRMSLAVDFLVQNEAVAVAAGASSTVKYGPVVIPPLEYGR
jgi:hypothetical protein